MKRRFQALYILFLENELANTTFTLPRKSFDWLSTFYNYPSKIALLYYRAVFVGKNKNKQGRKMKRRFQALYILFLENELANTTFTLPRKSFDWLSTFYNYPSKIALFYYRAVFVGKNKNKQVHKNEKTIPSTLYFIPWKWTC